LRPKDFGLAAAFAWPARDYNRLHPDCRPAMIVVLGDINIDICAGLDAPPALGQDCLASRLEFHCGGVGANTAIALARLGAPVRLLGSTGRDWFSSFALQRLARAGVDVSRVQQTEHAMTGVMFIAIGPDGQRTIFGSRGANAEAGCVTSDGAGSLLDGATNFHLMGYSFLSAPVANLAKLLLGAARQRGICISMDVGSAPSRLVPEDILRAAAEVDVMFANAEEAAALTGQADPHQAWGALERAGTGDVILKLGPGGCLLRIDGELRRVPSFPARAVDTTGAGDAFTAGFLRARLQGWSKAECAVLANATGAAAAEVMGAGECMPHPQRVLEVLSNSSLAPAWDEVRLAVIRRFGAELKPTRPPAGRGA